MNFTPKNSKGFEALEKDISYELEMLQIKYREVLKTGCYAKARIFISYKPLMNIEKFTVMKSNIILFFILRLQEAAVTKRVVKREQKDSEIKEPLQNKDKIVKEESRLTVSNFFEKLGLILEDLVTKAPNNTEYDLLYAFTDLLIKEGLLLKAKKLLNTARRNKWITVRYFKYQKLIETKLKTYNFY